MRLVLILAFLSGCVGVKETYLPDGNIGHSLNCSGAGNWGMCYEKAGEICGPRGYVVVAGGSEQGAVVSGTQYGLFGGTTTNRNMLIRCK